MENKNRILCDFPCPLHNNCRNYVEGFDKTRTKHWGVNPYKNGKCQGFAELTLDDLTDRVINAIKPFEN